MGQDITKNIHYHYYSTYTAFFVWPDKQIDTLKAMWFSCIFIISCMLYFILNYYNVVQTYIKNAKRDSAVHTTWPVWSGKDCTGILIRLNLPNNSCSPSLHWKMRSQLAFYQNLFKIINYLFCLTHFSICSWNQYKLQLNLRSYLILHECEQLWIHSQKKGKGKSDP